MAIIFNPKDNNAARFISADNIIYVLPNAAALDIFQHGVPEQAIIDNMRMHLGTRSVVIDIGAHVGTYAMNMSATCVLAFEPQRVTFNCLCAGIALNGLSNRVKAYNLALSDYIGTAELRIISVDGGGSSIVNALPTHTRPIATETVSVDTLDNICKREGITPSMVEFIKIDVEGNELAVLRGATHILTGRPKLLFEAWPAEWYAPQKNELLSYVQSLGYSVSNILDNPHMYWAEC